MSPCPSTSAERPAPPHRPVAAPRSSSPLPCIRSQPAGAPGGEVGRRYRQELHGHFLPPGLVWRAGRLSRLLVPYLRLLPAGIASLAGFVGVVELLSFLTIGAAQGRMERLL